MRMLRRDRLRARLRRRGGGLLPRDRALRRRPTSSRRATTRSPSTTRCSGPRCEVDQEGEPLGRRNQPLIEELLAVRRGRDRRPGEEPLRRLDDRATCSRDPNVQERRLGEKVYLLEDCTSPVVVPGVGRLHRRGRRRVRAASPRPACTSSARPSRWRRGRASSARLATGDELEPRVRPVAAADLGRRAAVRHHDVAGEVVLRRGSATSRRRRRRPARRGPRTPRSSRP